MTNRIIEAFDSDAKLLEEESYYRVEVDEDSGCDECGRGVMHMVVGEDGVAQSIFFEDANEAHEYCEALNAAYEKGKDKNKKTIEQKS